MRWLDEQAIGYAITADMSCNWPNVSPRCPRITGRLINLRPMRSASGPRSITCPATAFGCDCAIINRTILAQRLLWACRLVRLRGGALPRLNDDRRAGAVAGGAPRRRRCADYCRRFQLPRADHHGAGRYALYPADVLELALRNERITAAGEIEQRLHQPPATVEPAPAAAVLAAITAGTGLALWFSWPPFRHGALYRPQLRRFVPRKLEARHWRQKMHRPVEDELF